MAKRQEILNDIHNIINEGLTSSTKDFNSNLNLKKIIKNLLIESNSNPDMIKFLEPYNKELNQGTREELLAESLFNGVQRYAKVLPNIRSTVNELQKSINENRDNILLVQYYNNMNEGAQTIAHDAFINYMNNKSLNNKADLSEMLEAYSSVDLNVNNFLNYLNEQQINTIATPNVINLYDNVNESQTIDFNGQKFIEDEKGNLHPINSQKIQKINEAIDEYVDQKVNESLAEKEAEKAKKGHFYDIDNNIQLRTVVKDLQESYPNNKGLQDLLNEYASALNAGVREEMIYETFMQRAYEGYSYLNEVEDAINDMQDRIKDHKTTIVLTKILELMSEDFNYSHFVPLIEDCVIDYEKNPNAQNRSILMNQLRLYDSCPYVRNIMACVNSNNSKEGLLVRESNQFIQQKAHIDSIYSPIQYVKDNEFIFEAEDQYYVKKGQHISRLNKDSIKNLSENFLALSKLLNNPNVVINEGETVNDNTITFYSSTGTPIEINSKYAKINENYETVDDLKNLNKMHFKYNSYNDLDFITSAFLVENFDNIAEIDFGKEIGLNESNDKTLDLFRIKNNIFVVANDNINETHTFYRNVQPIQLKNIINNHFGLNVSNLFEDLLPNQDKILKQINAVKKEYETKINTLYETKLNLQKSLDSAINEADEDKFTSAIADIEEEINEAKKEYKKFQKKAKKLEEGNPEDSDTKDSDVLANAKDDLANTDPDPNATNIADDDFDMDASSEDNDLDFGDFDDFTGSDEDDDIFGSEEDFTGSDDGFMSSDGDLMTTPIGDDTDDTDNDFDTDPFNDIDPDEEPDTTEEMSQDEHDYEGITDENDVDDHDDLFGDSDPFGDDTNSLSDDEEGGDDNTIDDISDDDDQETEEVADDANLDYTNFKIVKVDFDYNVRTGERKNSGKVTVVVPWIDDEGNKTSETKSIDFYVTDIQDQKDVVLQTMGMSVEMYNAVKDAIKNSPDFNETEAGVAPDTIDTSDKDIDPVDKPDITQQQDSVTTDDDIEDHNENINSDTTEDNDFETNPISPEDTVLGEENPMDSEDTTEPFDEGSDETTILTIDDGIEPHGKDPISTYKDGDTDVELPADNVNMDGMFSDEPDMIPESHKGEILGVTTEGKHTKANKHLNESKKNLTVTFNALNETFNDEVQATEDKDTSNDDYPEEIVTSSTNQDDPIGLIADVFDSYNSENDGDADIDIEDYDVDGTDVNSITVTLGDNSYAFFTIEGDDNVYSCLSDDFEDNSQDIDSLNDFIASDDDNLTSCNRDDSEAIVDMAVNVITSETGETFDYDLEDPTGSEDEIEEPIEEGRQAKVNLKKNFDGNHNAKVHLRPHSDLQQITWKHGTSNDDSIEAYDAENGTDQQRRNKKIILQKAKKAGVPPTQQQQQGEEPGGAMM